MPKKHNVSSRPQAARLSKALVVTLCLALVARVGVLLLTPAALSTDPDGYWRLGENVAHHGTMGQGDVPSAFRPPVYPLLLTPCAMLDAGHLNKVAVGMLHVATGLATVALVFALAVRMGLNRWAPLAALLVAFDPILLRQSTLIMTETAATLLATAALFAIAVLLERPTVVRAVWVGITLATAALCRPVFLPWMVLSLVLLGVVLKRTKNTAGQASSGTRRAETKNTAGQAGSGTRRAETKNTAGQASSGTRRVEASEKSGASRTHPTGLLVFLTAVAVASAVLVPWIVRNQIQFKRPIVTTTHGGYTLYLGNNQRFYDYLGAAPWGSVWDAKNLLPRWNRDSDKLTPESELDYDRLCYGAATTTIRLRPRMFAYSCLVRVGRLWAVMPHKLPGRRLVGVWYTLEFLLAAIGVWAICRSGTARSPVWLWAILLVSCITAVHTVYWTNMRMRAPLQPIIALAATAGLASVIRRKSPRVARPERSEGRGE